MLLLSKLFLQERCFQVLFLSASTFLFCFFLWFVWCVYLFSSGNSNTETGNSFFFTWTHYSRSKKAGDETQGGRKSFIRVYLVADSIK